MRTILNYNIPPVKCFLHHAFPLGVFWDETDQNIMNWFCLNFNYIIAGTGPCEYVYTFLINHSSVPFIQRREIYGDELEKYLTKHSFSTLVKEMIGNGNLIEIMADMYYYPDSIDYQKNHSMHEILILGCDDEKETYIIRDYINHVFKEFEIPQYQIVPYENCSYYGDNIVMKLYRKKNNIFPFDKKAFLLQIHDYYNSINPFYRIGCVHGTYFEPWEKIFGMDVYNKIIEYLDSSDLVDYRPIRLIQEHFNCMKMKLAYIKNHKYLDLICMDNTLTYYTYASDKLENIVRLAVKQTLVPDEKKVTIKQRIISQLKEIIQKERIYLIGFLEESLSNTEIE